MENLKDITPEIVARFNAKLDKALGNGCWLWTGAKTPAGYGKMQYRRRGEFIYAHRLSLLLDGKQPFDSAMALHSCDNPSCVNPAHLRWGTQKENLRQAIQSGRAPHTGRVAGVKNGNAVLTDEIVAQIRNSSESNRILANRFGVGLSTISGVRVGRSWKHIHINEATAFTLSEGE
jgi:hypothetical protein